MATGLGLVDGRRRDARRRYASRGTSTSTPAPATRFIPICTIGFPTPYWTNEIALHDLYEGFFKLSPGIGGALSFPWAATYQTSRFYEGFDGYVGFWVLALAPCWFVCNAAFRSAKDDRTFADRNGDNGGTWSSPASHRHRPCRQLHSLCSLLAAGLSAARGRLCGRGAAAVDGIVFIAG